jgi:Flp pilus assembly protein TadD
MEMTFNLLGERALEDGNLEDAELNFAQALRQHPLDSIALDGLGRVCLRRRAYALAAELFQKALDFNSCQVVSRLNLARALNELGRYEQTLEVLERSTDDVAVLPDWLLLRGNALRACGLYQESLECYSLGLALTKTDGVEFLVNKANVLTEQKYFALAGKALVEASFRDPHNHHILFNLSLLRLRLGDWSQGWALHEHRPQVIADVARASRSSLSSKVAHASKKPKKILLFFEQGLGDTIQFLRFVNHEYFRDRSVTICVPTSLRRLAEFSFPSCRVTDQKEINPEKFDQTLSLLSIPAFLGFDSERDVHSTPYLRADPLRVEEIRKSLQAERKGLAIGIQWRGSDNPKLKNRSIPLNIFDKILPEGVVVFSLRKEVTREEKHWLQSREIIDLSDLMSNFFETAAVIENLDVVVTCDTSIAHLAGALGKRVVVLLPYAGAWVWMENRQDSPWYASMSLVRQQSPGHWESCADTIHRQRLI